MKFVAADELAWPKILLDVPNAVVVVVGLGKLAPENNPVAALLVPAIPETDVLPVVPNTGTEVVLGIPEIVPTPPGLEKICIDEVVDGNATEVEVTLEPKIPVAVLFGTVKGGAVTVFKLDDVPKIDAS